MSFKCINYMPSNYEEESFRFETPSEPYPPLYFKIQIVIHHQVTDYKFRTKKLIQTSIDVRQIQLVVERTTN